MRIKIEDIIFWIIILIIIAIAAWLLSGSPPEVNALISIALFVAASEMLLWKVLFLAEKKTEIGFIKVKKDLKIMKYELNTIKESLNLLKKSIKK